MILINLAVVLFAASTMSGAPVEPAPWSEASVAYRDAATGRYGAPAVELVRAEGLESKLAAMEGATLRLAEERLTGPAGGVRVRLRGALRSSLVLSEEERSSCVSAEAEAPFGAEAKL